MKDCGLQFRERLAKIAGCTPAGPAREEAVIVSAASFFSDTGCFQHAFWYCFAS
jgi:hypothetical protein